LLSFLDVVEHKRIELLKHGVYKTEEQNEKQEEKIESATTTTLTSLQFFSQSRDLFF